MLVQGGEQYGDRHELEGSLRFSDSGGRVELDAHLWFSSFLAGFASEGTAWTLPALPAQLAEAQQGNGAPPPPVKKSLLPLPAWTSHMDHVPRQCGHRPGKLSQASASAAKQHLAVAAAAGLEAKIAEGACAAGERP